MTCNRFKILVEGEEEDHEMRLINDSIVRELLHKFCGRARTTRKRLCMPGARLDNITAACEEVNSMSNLNTLLIIHAGTNDVINTRLEELLQKYKTKYYKIIVSGILLQSCAPTIFYNRVFNTSNCLKYIYTLCPCYAMHWFTIFHSHDQCFTSSFFYLQSLCTHVYNW